MSLFHTFFSPLRPPTFSITPIPPFALCWKGVLKIYSQNQITIIFFLNVGVSKYVQLCILALTLLYFCVGVCYEHLCTMLKNTWGHFPQEAA